MKTKLIVFIILLLTTTVVIAQKGINYKAVIKDNSGNVLVNQNITIEFSILEGPAINFSDEVYVETHTTMTDVNGIVIVNIGEGVPESGFEGAYGLINWGSFFGSHFLNVQMDTGSGFVDMGTTEFKAVPFALYAENSNYTGLEIIDEGNGTGWRLIGRIPENYGPIANNAVDLSYSPGNSTTRGATGNYATASGYQTTASGQSSFASGVNSVASGTQSTALGAGTVASGHSSTAMGIGTKAEAPNSTAIGLYNVGGGNPLLASSTDPLFEIGNGNYVDGINDVRTNALTVLRNGTITAPSFDMSEITDPKALITKEFADANYSGGSSGSSPTGLEAIDEGNGVGWRLVGSNPANFGNVGLNAVDLSVSLLSDDTYGATGAHSFSAGYLTKASGNFSVALGNNASAGGSNSISLGDTSSAIGYRSFAAGYFSIAEGQSSVAIGESASSVGISAVALGKGTQANGDYSLSTGNFTIAGGVNSAAFGVNTNASGASSIAFGTLSGVSGASAFAGGYESLASGDYSIALGYQTEANNLGAVALGRSTLASGNSSFASGTQTTASGESATAMGLNTIASGDRATAIGVGCDATGFESLALGSTTLASGTYSTAIGRSTIASESTSTAMGSFTIADDGSSTVVGRYNDNTSSTTTLFQIGNGLNLSNRTNAFTVLQNGYASVGTHDEEPTTDFQIYHDNGGTENGFKLLNKGVNKNWWRFYTLNSNGDLYMYSKAGGNASAVGSFNDVSGAYTALSDRRVKDDFKDLYFNWESFMQLKPLTYHYKTDQNKQSNIGFIAQDVESIYPELVNYNKESDLYQLNYSGFGVVAIKAIQQQQLVITSQQDRIEILEAKLAEKDQAYNELNSRIEAIETLLNTSDK